jgi:hypothetical protein
VTSCFFSGKLDILLLFDFLRQDQRPAQFLLQNLVRFARLIQAHTCIQNFAGKA